MELALTWPMNALAERFPGPDTGFCRWRAVRRADVASDKVVAANRERMRRFAGIRRPNNDGWLTAL